MGRTTVSSIVKWFWRRWNARLKSNKGVLGAWASLLQIIVFPTALITVLVGYSQPKQYITKPDLHLEFSDPRALAFTIVNHRDVVAEGPSYGFAVFDLDSAFCQKLTCME